MSDIDGNYYLVQKDKSKGAANLLATINMKILKVINFLELKLEEIEGIEKVSANNTNQSDNYKDILEYKNHIMRLKNKYSHKIISENNNTSYTSYSMGKTYIVFCIRQRDQHGNEHDFVDINVLMYVALHELSHFGSVGIVLEHQHNTDKEFRGFFKLLLDAGVDSGEYSALNKREPYCGLIIK